MVFNSVTIVEDLAEHIDEEHTMIWSVSNKTLVIFLHLVN